MSIKDELVQETLVLEILNDKSKQDIANIDPELIESNLEIFLEKNKHLYFNIFLDNKNLYHRLSNSIWINYLNNRIGNWEISRDQLMNGNLYYKIYKILSTSDSPPNKEEIFKSCISAANKLPYIPNERTLLFYFAKDLLLEDNSKIMNLIRSTEFKSWTMTARLDMYLAAIETGNIDEKISRRIRSESSERVCYLATSLLLSKSKTYPYEKFKENIIQFVDLKHEDAQYLISQSIDYKLIPYFLGFSSKNAKNVLEKRLSSEAPK